MHYVFPHIYDIQDVLWAIDGSDEFIVVEKDGYTVINYVVAGDETFPPIDYTDPDVDVMDIVKATVRRECRGLIFDSAGEIISRRYHKFFNVNEREETRFEKIDFSQPHRILEKLDGSMISPIMIKGHIYLTTKMGITEVAETALDFWDQHPQYEEHALSIMEEGYTPIYEWCSNKNRIVVDYPVDRLVLTAVRNNYTGEYLSYENLLAIGTDFNIDVVKAYEPTEDLLRHISELEGEEGVVVRFDDGHMVKIKSEWYVLRHKSKDAITREKNVLSYVVEDRVDDVLPYLTEEDQKRLRQFEADFWHGFQIQCGIYENIARQAMDAMDKKTWAITEKPKYAGVDEYVPPIVFNAYAGIPVSDSILNIIKKHLTSATRVNEVRHFFGGLRWEYTFESDS